MKVKRSYAIELNNVLSRADQVFKAPITGRFYYMVSYNRKLTEEERKLTLEAFPYDENFVAYESKRIEMLNKAGVYSNADIEKLSPEARSDLEAAVTKWRDDNIDVIKAEEAIDVERNKFLDEDIDLNLKTFTPDELPEIIAEDNWAVYNILEPLIKEA